MYSKPTLLVAYKFDTQILKGCTFCQYEIFLYSINFLLLTFYFIIDQNVLGQQTSKEELEKGWKKVKRIQGANQESSEGPKLQSEQENK